MRQRLLVMNGQKLVQSEQDGQWVTTKVEKAGAVKPGLYNIYLSQPVDKATKLEGIALHADKNHLYQQVGKAFFMHDLRDFEKVPESGKQITITYDGERALVAMMAKRQGRNLSR